MDSAESKSSAGRGPERAASKLEGLYKKKHNKLKAVHGSSVQERCH